MKLGALATGAATTTLVLGAVVTLTPAQSIPPREPGVGSAGTLTPLKFDHAAHAALDNPVDVANCEQCHGENKTGALEPVASHGHQPCLAAGCHAEDFLSVGARTKRDAPERYREAAGFCLGCHDSATGRAPSPFARAQADNLYKNNPKPGHYVEMNHLAHTKAAAKQEGGGCLTCHVVDAETFELAPQGPGHFQCATCHGGEATVPGEPTPEFAMEDCGKCHQSGTPASYFKKRTFTTDVRSCNSKRYAKLSEERQAKVPCFEHEREGHRIRENGQPVQCGHCHFMFSSKSYEGYGYETLREVKQAPLMDNSRDRAHAKCGTAGCHRSAVDDSQGTGRCSLCHSSKSILGNLLGGSSSRPSPSSLVDEPGDEDEKPKNRRKRRKRKRHSLEGLVN